MIDKYHKGNHSYCKIISLYDLLRTREIQRLQVDDDGSQNVLLPPLHMDKVLDLELHMPHMLEQHVHGLDVHNTLVIGQMLRLLFHLRIHMSCNIRYTQRASHHSQC